MGSRGSFLESGGFRVPARWQTVGYIDGIKVLAPKDPSASLSLPERANTPGTTYVIYRENGVFKQLITFDENRMPIYEIDYGPHNHVLYLHVHFYINGNRFGEPTPLLPGNPIYEKYKRLFKGVRL